MRGYELNQCSHIWNSRTVVDVGYSTLNMNGMGNVGIGTSTPGSWGTSGHSGTSGTSGTSGSSGTSGVRRRSHSDYLSDAVINYSEYIGEQLDKSINYSEYIAESTNSNKSKILNVSNTQGIEFKQSKSKVVNALDLLK